MDCCEDRSASRRSTAVFLLFVVISLLASSPLARSRQTMTTVAPIWASASAVAFPIPELAPVTMQIFPCILLFTVGMMRSLFMRLGEVVCVFVCVMSVLLLQVLLRWFLEPSHTCFLTSNACGESDRLLDTRRDRVGCQQEGALCQRIIRAFGN